MMGKTQESMDARIMKATNAVVIMNKKDTKKTAPSPCIHCGRCVAVCPLGLNPTAFARAMELEDDAARAALLQKEQVKVCMQCALLQKEQVKVCMQCGCCSYVCPAHRPLAENNNAGIGFLRKWEKEHPEGGKN